MGLLDSILGGGVQAAGEGVGAVLGGLGGLAKDIREAITGDIPADKKAELEQKAQELENAVLTAQIAVNLKEAESQRLFVSGWRPFIGWVCGCGLAYQFIGFSLIEWAAKAAGSTIAPPVLNTEGLVSIVIPLLGLAGFRTIEKIKGVDNR